MINKLSKLIRELLEIEEFRVGDVIQNNYIVGKNIALDTVNAMKHAELITLCITLDDVLMAMKIQKVKKFNTPVSERIILAVQKRCWRELVKYWQLGKDLANQWNDDLEKKNDLYKFLMEVL